MYNSLEWGGINYTGRHREFHKNLDLINKKWMPMGIDSVFLGNVWVGAWWLVAVRSRSITTHDLEHDGKSCLPLRVIKFSSIQHWSAQPFGSSLLKRIHMRTRQGQCNEQISYQLYAFNVWQPRVSTKTLKRTSSHSWRYLACHVCCTFIGLQLRREHGG